MRRTLLTLSLSTGINISLSVTQDHLTLFYFVAQRFCLYSLPHNAINKALRLPSSMARLDFTRGGYRLLQPRNLTPLATPQSLSCTNRGTMHPSLGRGTTCSCNWMLPCSDHSGAAPKPVLRTSSVFKEDACDEEQQGSLSFRCSLLHSEYFFNLNFYRHADKGCHQSQRSAKV